MGKCDNCRLRKESAKAFDIHWLEEDDCPYDKCPVPDFPKTNADRIRSMTDEELAEFLKIIPHCGNPPTYTTDGFCIEDGLRTKRQWLDWLKQEVFSDG